MGRSVPGHCLCGSVRFTATLKNDEMHVCHCDMCRTWSGGVFMSVECSDIAVEEGGDLGLYASSDWAERGFCRNCGASLFWRTRDGAPDFKAVALPSLDTESSFSFAGEIFIDRKPDLYAFAGDRPRKTGAEVMAEFSAVGAD